MCRLFRRSWEVEGFLGGWTCDFSGFLGFSVVTCYRVRCGRCSSVLDSVVFRGVGLVFYGGSDLGMWF